MRGVVRALGLGVLVLGSAGCWPVPGHDPDRTGFNDLETAITPETVGTLEESWTWTGAPNVQGPVRSPVVSSGGVHVAAGCALVTLHAVSGAERWGVGLPNIPEAEGWPCNGYIRQARDPFVVGDTVQAGMVFRFDGRPPPSPVTPIYLASTGSWHVATGEPVPDAPGVDAALEARRDGIVASLDGRGTWTGTPPLLTPGIETWPVLGPEGGSQRALPVTSDGRMTVGTDAAYVVTRTSLAAFSVHDPELTCGAGTTECPLWTATLDAPVAGRPVIGPGRPGGPEGPGGTTVYVGTTAGTVHAIDAATGAVAWTASVGSAVTDSPALAHDTLYVPTSSGDLVAVPAGGCGASTCPPAWSAATGSRISSQPVVAGGVVVTGSEEGALRAFDAAGCGSATCPALWSASASSMVTGMAVSGGSLYVGTAATRLIAYRLPDAPAPEAG
jgi:outer membrane protein assembly factor BamB